MSEYMDIAKESAIRTLGDMKTPMISTFLGIDINCFTKDELIKILSLQHRGWLESIGFKYV